MENIVKEIIKKAIYKAFEVSGQMEISNDSDKVNKFRTELEPFCEVVCRTIDIRFRHLTGEDIARAIELGSAGHYGIYYKINTNVIMNWIGLRWNDIRHYYNQQKEFDDRHKEYVDLNKYPMASAILFKVKWMNPKNWDEINTKELAEAIARDGDKGGKHYCSLCGFQMQKQHNIITEQVSAAEGAREFLKTLADD